MEGGDPVSECFCLTGFQYVDWIFASICIDKFPDQIHGIIHENSRWLASGIPDNYTTIRILCGRIYAGQFQGPRIEPAACPPIL